MITQKRERGRRSRGPGIWFLLPSLLGVSVFVLIPFLDVIRRSFTNVMGTKIVGIANYKTVLTNQAFLQAGYNTVRFLAVCLPLLLGLSLLLALLLYSAADRAGFFKTAFLLPMSIPVASIVLLWQLLFQGDGIVNGLLVQMGGDPVQWMDSPKAFAVLVGSFLWKNIGYDIVLWMAGLAAIPQSLYEAAKVDGAGNFRIFWKITLPGLLPCVYTILVLSLLNAFKVFREAWLVAGDYPHTSIYLLQHTFNNWFRELSIDRLSAGAIIVAAVALVIILVSRKLLDRE